MTCTGPMRLAIHDYDQATVEKRWRRDRKNHVICRNNHDALVMFYQDLRNRLSTPEH